MDFDVAIIGNGAIACALALRLTHEHPELQVALVGPALRPGCASLAAGAMLNVFAELEAGALETPLARARFSAAMQATALWDAHLALLNARLVETPPIRVVPGTYVVGSDRDDANFDAIHAALLEHRQRFREVSPRDIPGLRPAPHAAPRRALYLEDEGMVSASALHRAYDEALARTPRLTRLDTEATALVPSGDASRASTAVHTQRGGALRTRQVILAAGARTQELIDQLGLQAKIPRLVHGVGVSLVLKTAAALPAQVIRTPRRGLAHGFYLVPYDGGYCYLGATSALSPTAARRPSVDSLHHLLRSAIEQVSPELAAAEVHKTLVGSRPTTLDTYPLLGRTSIEGVWIASGTRRDGFHLSPKIAQELTAALASGTQPFSGAFPPERPLYLPPGRQRAVDRAVAALVAAAGEPSESSDAALRAHVEDAYARSGLDTHDLGIPTELLDLYRQGHAGENLEHLLAQRRSTDDDS